MKQIDERLKNSIYLKIQSAIKNEFGTLSAYARQIGVGPATLSQVIRGNTQSRFVIERICNDFGFSPMDFPILSEAACRYVKRKRPCRHCGQANP